jgi:hypothetical protein
VADELKEKSGSDLIRTIVWSAAAVVLSYIGVWTAGTLEDLSDSVSGLKTSVMLLEQRITQLPPAEMIYKIEQIMRQDEIIRRKIEAHESRLDKLENSQHSFLPYEDLDIHLNADDGWMIGDNG